jgi:hypothetical protein
VIGDDAGADDAEALFDARKVARCDARLKADERMAKR